MHAYRKMWKLEVNVDKIKLVVFRRCKLLKMPDVVFNNKFVVVEDRLNLGMQFNYNGYFSNTNVIG